MFGIVLALANPLLVAGQNALAKIRLHDKSISDEAVVFARLFYVVPFFAAYLAYAGLPATIGDGFWLLMLVMIGAEIPSQWYFHQAIKEDQISLVLPLAGLLGPLLLMTSVVLNDTTWNALGITGIITVSVGVYALHLPQGNMWNQLLTPIRSMLSKRASRYMLLTVLLWTVTTHLQRETLIRSSLPLMGMLYLSGASLGVILVARLRANNPLSVSKVVAFNRITKLAPIGIIAGIAGLCQYGSLYFIEPATMIALKETLILWAVVFDKLVFKQQVSSRQALCLIIITLGAILTGIGTL